MADVLTWRNAVQDLMKWPIISLVLLAACHDTRRNNLLDPELTPAVELSAVLDETIGTVTLDWTVYTGATLLASMRAFTLLMKMAMERISDS